MLLLWPPSYDEEDKAMDTHTPIMKIAVEVGAATKRATDSVLCCLQGRKGMEQRRA